MSRKGIRRKWINPTFTGNGPAFEEDTVVYKLVGPVLVEQETDEAKANVKKRIDYLNTELWVSRKNDQKRHIILTFFCVVSCLTRNELRGHCVCTQHQKQPKQKELCSKKYKKQSRSNQILRVILSNIRTNTVRSLLQVMELQKMLQQAQRKEGVSK